ncbi:MAG: hypothetical protein WA060_00115 [Minisyncoccia bacterium]
METAAEDNLLGGTVFDSQYFNPEYLFNQGMIWAREFIQYITSDQAINIGKTILFFLAMFFLTIISYVIVRMLEIRKKEHDHLHHEIHEYAHNKAEYEKRLHEEVGGSKNEHWGTVLSYLFSQHKSDWKLAIIEADTMLDGLMDQLGFHGESLGDKLKLANQENFPQLTTAWEVHTVRNKIAHEGLAFELSQHEAKRIIALYEQIFHTYGYI